MVEKASKFHEKKIIRNIGISLISLLLFAYFYLIYPFWGMPFNAQRHGNPPLTPAWALECWLWEDDVNTAAYVDELLEGYAEHDIPVRTILIDRHEKIYEAVEGLSEKRRIIIKLNYDEGKSYEEIANQLNISKNTVKNQLVKAKQVIRRQLEIASML